MGPCITLSWEEYVRLMSACESLEAAAQHVQTWLNQRALPYGQVPWAEHLVKRCNGAAKTMNEMFEKHDPEVKP